MKARLLSEAEAEIREAAQWYEAQRPGLAGQFLQAVLDGVLAIEKNPQLHPHPPGFRSGRSARRRILDGFPYSVIYEVRAAEILIIAIAHFRRRPGYWNERDG